MNKSPFTRERQKLQELLRTVRQQKGLRQTDLAAKLGRPQSYVSKYESGERRIDLVEVWEICAAIGVPLDEFARRFRESVE